MMPFSSIWLWKSSSLPSSQLSCELTGLGGEEYPEAGVQARIRTLVGFLFPSMLLPVFFSASHTTSVRCTCSLLVHVLPAASGSAFAGMAEIRVWTGAKQIWKKKKEKPRNENSCFFFFLKKWHFVWSNCRKTRGDKIRLGEPKNHSWLITIVIFASVTVKSEQIRWA